MSYLGDYIGYLLAEITNARAQADHEAVRIAEEYAKDPYLKHIPIPRFRMPNVTIDVPIVINNIEEPEIGQYSNDRILSYIQAKLQYILPTQLKKVDYLNLKSVNIDTISKRTRGIIEDFKRLDYTPIRITYLADKLVGSITESLIEFTPSNDKQTSQRIEEFGNELRHYMYSEFSKYLRQQPRLDITANTAEVKNAGPKDILAYLRFTITEEAFEWTTIEEENVKTRRLIPE